jgi:hypothetical protein
MLVVGSEVAIREHRGVGSYEVCLRWTACLTEEQADVVGKMWMCSEEAVLSEDGLEEGSGEFLARKTAEARCGGGVRHTIIRVIKSVGGDKKRAAQCIGIRLETLEKLLNGQAGEDN